MLLTAQEQQTPAKCQTLCSAEKTQTKPKFSILECCVENGLCSVFAVVESGQQMRNIA